MKKRKPFVAPGRAKAIVAFGRALARLCKKHGVEISAAPEDGIILLVDLKRKEPMPEGYQFDASFYGCDPKGVYQEHFCGIGGDRPADAPLWEKSYGPVRVEGWLPEDEDPDPGPSAALKKARGMA